MESTNRSKARSQFFKLSIRKSKQQELISAKRIFLNEGFLNNLFDRLIENKTSNEFALELTDFILGFGKMDITLFQALNLLTSLTSRNNCNDLLMNLSDDRSHGLFSFLMRKINESSHYSICCILLSNILCDDTKETILNYLILELGLLNIIEDKLKERKLKELNELLLILKRIIGKDVIQKDIDFLRRVVSYLEDIVTDKGNYSTYEDVIIITGCIVSCGNKNLIDMDKTPTIKTIAADLYNKEIVREKRNIDVVNSIIKLFGTVILVNDDIATSKNILLNVITIDSLIILLKEKEFIIKKNTMWLFKNLLANLEDEEEIFREWESCFRTIFNCLYETSLHDFDILKHEATESLVYLFCVFDNEFLNDFFETRELMFILYFEKAFKRENLPIIDNYIMFFETCLQILTDFPRAVKEDEQLTKTINNLQEIMEIGKDYDDFSNLLDNFF